VASILLLTEATMTEIPEEKPARDRPVKGPEQGTCRKKRRRIRAKSTVEMIVAPQRWSS